ncbi:hypothetical protein Dimus_030082, partial [Dionaea muscipula]
MPRPRRKRSRVSFQIHPPLPSLSLTSWLNGSTPGGELGSAAGEVLSGDGVCLPLTVIDEGSRQRQGLE